MGDHGFAMAMSDMRGWRMVATVAVFVILIGAVSAWFAIGDLRDRVAARRRRDQAR